MIRTGVQAFLQAWTGARLVGMDVVGLPACGGSSMMDPFLSLDEQMGIAVQDIVSFCGSATGYG